MSGPARYETTPPSVLSLIDRVADWAELMSVDYGIYRDGCQWVVQMKFSDSNGPFSAYFELPVKSVDGSLEGKLDRACIEARKQRLKVVRYSKAS